MKTCTKCNQEKEETKFSVRKSSKIGLYAECKACRAAYAREQSKVPEVRERQKLSRIARREKIKIARQRRMQDPVRRAKRNAWKRNRDKERRKDGTAKRYDSYAVFQWGITYAERSWLESLALGFCWLCQRAIRGYKMLDHDHACVEHTRMCKKCIRGIVCNWCNTRVIPILENAPHLRNEYTEAYLNSRPFLDEAKFFKEHLLGRPFLERIDESVIDLSRNLGVV